jgi:phage-related protein
MQKKTWKIAFYQDKNKTFPVQVYMFDGTNETDINNIMHVIGRLSRVGQYLLETNMAKRLGGDLYELRKNRHRIIYAQDGERFILLSAFLKDTQQTPLQEISLAEKHLEDYRITKNCQEFVPPGIY